MKIVCMIPARLGSSRIKMKNLRFLGDKPLVAHVLETCVKSGLFADVYLNSEADVFEGIAKNYGAKFYKRPDQFSTNEATNDDFVLDFISKVNCDIVIQVNPTAPFITTDDLKGVIEKMTKEGFETVQTLKEERIEGLFKGQSLNFDPIKKMPRSQDLEPVYLFSSCIMGFTAKRFKQNMMELDAATYGGKGKTGYFVTSGFSNVDIDYEEDFAIAEVIFEMLNKKSKKEIKYFNGTADGVKTIGEADRDLILKMDGVGKRSMSDFNLDVVAINDIISRHGRTSSWAHTVVDSKSNTATLIGQLPGEGNRMHFHPDWDEWWYIVEGQWEWTIEGQATTVKQGDIVFIHRNRKHKIKAIGDKMAIRLAVSRADVVHVYNENDY
jgi:CMP-N-acetylneuraminic acid synthetase/quercetin dioxygenase-like cupin family protein